MIIHFCWQWHTWYCVIPSNNFVEHVLFSILMVPPPLIYSCFWYCIEIISHMVPLVLKDTFSCFIYIFSINFRIICVLQSLVHILYVWLFCSTPLIFGVHSFFNYGCLNLFCSIYLFTSTKLWIFCNISYRGDVLVERFKGHFFFIFHLHICIGLYWIIILYCLSITFGSDRFLWVLHVELYKQLV